MKKGINRGQGFITLCQGIILLLGVCNNFYIFIAFDPKTWLRAGLDRV